MTNPCRDTGHFETSAPNDPKLTLSTSRSYVPYIYMLLGSMSPKFHSISLHDEPFSCYRPFWEKCTQWPQNDLEPYKVKLSYICITSVPDSQMSLHFTLRPAIFEIQAILRQVHRMIPNWPWTQQRQITLYLYNNCPRVSNFTPFGSTTSRFGVTGHFETRAPNDLKMTLNITRSKVHHICVTSVPESHILVSLLYDQRFPWYSTFHNSPLTPMLNAPKRTEKTSQFFIQLW